MCGYPPSSLVGRRDQAFFASIPVWLPWTPRPSHLGARARQPQLVRISTARCKYVHTYMHTCSRYIRRRLCPTWPDSLLPTPSRIHHHPQSAAPYRPPRAKLTLRIIVQNAFRRQCFAFFNLACGAPTCLAKSPRPQVPDVMLGITRCASLSMRANRTPRQTWAHALKGGLVSFPVQPGLSCDASSATLADSGRNATPTDGAKNAKVPV